MVTEWKRLGLLVAGQISVGLAILGAFLPLLPTTPFLILAAYCFMRSSPASYNWLVNHRILGPFLRDWQRHQGIRRSVKASATLIIVGLAGATWWLMPHAHLLRSFALMGSVAGLIVVLRLPTISYDEIRQPQNLGPNRETGITPNAAHTSR